MDFTKMTMAELEARLSAINTEIEAPDADLTKLEEEIRAIQTEKENRKAAEAKRAELRAKIAAGAGVFVEGAKPEAGKAPRTDDEIRNSTEYINAYAEYIKTGDPTECRALLTSNVSGTVAVPDYVEGVVRTAWAKEGIVSRVRKSYIKGNLKVGFEISSTPAQKHVEGAGEVSEETLVLGTVTLVPASIKKWISISDEVLDLRGTAFLDYIYDELTYRIAKKAADDLVAQINACGTVSTTTCPSVPKITEATLGIGTIAKAVAALSDEANNPVIMMNKLTWGAFKAVQAANNYGYDPFEGLPVVFNNTITAYSAATTGVTYAIVGDLDQGALMNFPDGENVTLKYDDKTLMTSDLIKILGRQYVASGVVAPDAFVKVTK